MPEPVVEPVAEPVVEPPPSVVTTVARRLASLGHCVATAESLTGGLVAGAITEVAGASLVYRGGVVAYATELKHTLLGVDASLLARVGAVHPQVAAAMAAGVRERLGATYGLSTTGVAGPSAQDGHPPGTVWVGLADGSRSWAVDASWPCGRPGASRVAVRARAVLVAWTALSQHLQSGDDAHADWA